MKISRLPILAAGLVLAACASAPPQAPPPDNATLRGEVIRTERAFARTLAERDFSAFKSFLADETVFFGETQAVRGAPAVAERWKHYFDGPAAPFSWEPEKVEVLDSGTLALSSGPVHDPDGKLIGTFNSIWRRTPAGDWRIIFDKGCEVCDCKTP
jgi:ketosteroid isomerase-like protein